MDGDTLRLFAPNRFIQDWVKGKFLGRISEIVKELADDKLQVMLEVTPVERSATVGAAITNDSQRSVTAPTPVKPLTAPFHIQGQFSLGPESLVHRRNMDTIIEGKLRHRGALNSLNTFDNFIEGKSNQLAKAASIQVAVDKLLLSGEYKKYRPASQISAQKLSRLIRHWPFCKNRN